VTDIAIDDSVSYLTPETDSETLVLPANMLNELIDGDGDVITMNDDGEEVENIEISESPSPPAMEISLLAAAKAFMQSFAHSCGMERTSLPSCLSRTDRSVLHDLAEELGLEHESVGEEGSASTSRYMQIWRKAPVAGGSNMTDPLEDLLESMFDEAWEQSRIKYDPRHW
jgi:hypothetical protein